MRKIIWFEIDDEIFTIFSPFSLFIYLFLGDRFCNFKY